MNNAVQAGYKSVTGSLQQAAQETSVKKNGDVTSGIKQLDHWITELEAAATLLTDRLSCLINPSPCTIREDDKKSVGISLSPLGQELERQVSRVAHVTRSLLDLKDSVEL